MTPVSSQLAPIVVKKRSGQHVPFFETRIQQAIESACKAQLNIPQEAGLDPAWQAQVNTVTARVVDSCQRQMATQTVLFIEDIQDAVIVELRASGHADIADRYAAYRQQQERKRVDAQRVTVQKRDGRTVSFKPEKIVTAIGRAFASLAPQEPLSSATRQRIVEAADRVVGVIRQAHASAPGTVHIEHIQDLVEHVLAEHGHAEVARRYVVYRTERRHLREHTPQPEPAAIIHKEMLLIRTAAGTEEHLDIERLKLSIAEACHGLEDKVSVEQILQRTLQNCFHRMTTGQMHEAMLLAMRSLIEQEPAYHYVTARMLLKHIYRDVVGRAVRLDAMAGLYAETFVAAIRRAIDVERLTPELLAFDLERLGRALRAERDLQFQYMGLQTLYDRYLIHHEGQRLEAPQIFWMRIAMGLAQQEGAQRNERAISFYEVLSTFRFVSSTPTLFNAGTRHPQLSSCFLTTVGDDLDNIFKSIKDNALLSKWSGGLGNDWTPVRALGAHIHGTNGKSQGVIPFMKVANDTAVAVNQGGKRQGAVCAYIEVWHMDIEEFLELRKNVGDERRRTHDMHTANWIPDLFMQRVQTNAEWTLFSPNETPDLHDLYGAAFVQRYEAYEAMTRAGKIRCFKRLPAVQLWRKMLSMLFETGHPWITFKDPSNIRSPQDHAGVVHSSNLCTEILLNTSREETAVCNLGSVNVAAHTTPAGLDHEQLAETVQTAIRMLDNVIDVNYYPTSDARQSNVRHRPVGLGLMGFQDALSIQGYGYASHEAIAFADESMEFIAYHALLASSQLARERGAYPSYAHSKWSRGLLPIDTIALLEQERGGHLRMDRGQHLDWTPVRESIAQYGMRNSNTMAIAPTATIANIVGVTQSIEPTYKNLFVKSNLSGEFTVVNSYLVEELSALDLWDEQMVNDIKYFDGALQEIERIPQVIKDRYTTAFEIGYEWLIECASRRQKWIDMGQSLNLYLAEPSGKKLHAMYHMAWEYGLKTTYYLRSLGATRIEKSTLDANKYGNPLGQKHTASEPVVAAASCRVDDPDCEACQ